MRHTLAALIRNLVAGFRVACLLPVTQLAFRVDLPQLVLLFFVSSALDAGRDAIRAGPERVFNLVRRRQRVLQRGRPFFIAAR